MNNTMLEFAPLAIAAAVALAACGKKEEAPAPKAEPAKAAAAPAEVVKIGHVAPSPAPLPTSARTTKTAPLAVEEINAAGGLKLGEDAPQLDLLAEDDNADPKQGTRPRTRWSTPRVAVVGHLNSGTSIPASQIYADADVTQISPSATNPKFTRSGLPDDVPRRRG